MRNLSELARRSGRGLSYELARDAAVLRQARELHGRVYLESGYVTELTDGVIVDEHVEASTYFVAIDSERESVSGVCRQISQHCAAGLPTLKHFDVDPAFMSLVQDLAPNAVVEISALAVDPVASRSRRVLAAELYRLMYRSSVSGGAHRLWVANIAPRMLDAFNRLLTCNFITIGRPTFYMGSETVPVALDLGAVWLHMQRVNPQAHAWFSDELPGPPPPVKQLVDATTALSCV